MTRDPLAVEGGADLVDARSGESIEERGREILMLESVLPLGGYVHHPLLQHAVQNRDEPMVGREAREARPITLR